MALTLNWFSLEGGKADNDMLVQGKSLNLKNIPGCSLHMNTPTLWVHGGHPFLPSSADIYYKMQQLFNLCDKIWPDAQNQRPSGMVLIFLSLWYFAHEILML